jgi:hypothetical protein
LSVKVSVRFNAWALPWSGAADQLQNWPTSMEPTAATGCRDATSIASFMSAHSRMSKPTIPSDEVYRLGRTQTTSATVGKGSAAGDRRT